MVNAVSAAQNLDWRGWLVGAFGALISGAAVTLSGWGFGVAPKAIAGMAGISAVVSLAKYLQTQPLPAKEG